MPYASAFAAGATHALVLRSREAGYRKSDYHGLQVALVGRRLPKIRQAFRERPARYNDEAAELEAAHRDGRGDLRQIVPPQTDDPVSQLERDPQKIAAGLRSGASAAAAVFARGDVDLLWEPRVYCVGA